MNSHSSSRRFQNRNEFRAVEARQSRRKHGEMTLSPRRPFIERHAPASLDARPFAIEPADAKLDSMQET